MKPVCVVSCPIDTFSGYGARSRDFVRALILSKDKEWDIKIMPQRWGDTPWNFLAKDDPIRKRYIQNLEQRPDIWIQITIPNEFQVIGSKLNIGVTAGVETDVFPPDWIEGLNRMDLNLMSSSHSKKVALESTYEKKDKNTNQVIGHVKCVKPVEVLFEGLDLSTYFKKPPTCMDIKMSKILSDVEENFCFLYTGGWLPGIMGEDRKNVSLMIKTFLETFNTPSKSKPALILKTHHVNGSLIDREEVLNKINQIRKTVQGDLPNIYLLHGEMTDKEMNLLNNDPKIKSFISFTKGEGFGRPLIEGAITGKPVITTNWSGHTDFINPDYNILIGGELKEIHESAANQWLIKGSKWFSIDTNIASRALKDVFKNYKNYYKKSRKQTQYIKDNWSFSKMKEKLDSFLKIKIETTPKQVELKLPKLKKSNNTPELPKLKLPKLKKIEA